MRIIRVRNTRFGGEGGDGGPEQYSGMSGFFHVVSSSSSSYLSLTSPTDGNQWKEGSVHTITWNSVNVPPSTELAICLKTENSSISPGVCIGAVPNSGSYTMAVPSDAASKGYSVEYNLSVGPNGSNDTFLPAETNVTVVP